MCDRGKDKGQEKEIERVQSPSEKASDESVALCAAQRFEQTQRFHVGSASCHVERSRDISELFSEMSKRFLDFARNDRGRAACKFRDALFGDDPVKSGVGARWLRRSRIAPRKSESAAED